MTLYREASDYWSAPPTVVHRAMPLEGRPAHAANHFTSPDIAQANTYSRPGLTAGALGSLMLAIEGAGIAMDHRLLYLFALIDVVGVASITFSTAVRVGRQMVADEKRAHELFAKDATGAAVATPQQNLALPRLPSPRTEPALDPHPSNAAAA